MYRLFSTGIEVISAAIVILPLLLLFGKIYRHNIQTTLVHVVFALYLTSIYTVVGLPTILYFRIDLYTNLVPFLDMVADFKNAILNIILFIPLGFMLPLLSDKFKTLKRTFLFGLGATLTIEILQLFTYRTTDINDIITNVTGTLIGYFLFKKINQRFPLKLVDEQKNYEVYLLCTISFLTMFCVQPFISAVFWEAAIG